MGVPVRLHLNSRQSIANGLLSELSNRDYFASSPEGFAAIRRRVLLRIDERNSFSAGSIFSALQERDFSLQDRN